MTDTIRTFRDLAPEQRPLAGGKGGTLARLYQLGYPVPDGLILLPAAFAGDELSPQARTALRPHLARMRGGDSQAAFAVRSSALAEDSARASFAGEFETVLGVQGDEEVLEAIRLVRRSRHSRRVQAYSQARGLDGLHEMAVVVQRLVPADLSGVLFTADPITGSRDRMVGDAIHGLGEALVSGTAEAQEFTLARPRFRFEGPPELRPYARRLLKLALRLERELGTPQDIEWAIAGNALYLLQSRPITTLLGFDPVTGEFNDTLTGDFVWSSVNVGEAVSVVMTPFTWSLLRGAYRELDVVPGYASLGNIGGRAYQNVTVMFSMFRALGRSFEDLSREMGGVREEFLETMDQYLHPLPGATFFAVLPRATRMIIKQRRGLRKLASFISQNPGWCRDMCRRIEATSAEPDLASLLVEEIQPYLRQGFWRVIATAWRYGELVGRLRPELVELVGAQDADALLSNVGTEAEMLASLGPLVGLARVARGEMSREAYLERWGHRGALETEASVPRPFEDPDWLEEQLALFRESPVDVEALLSAQRADFQAAFERLQDRHPGVARSVRRRLETTAEAARTREAVRSELTRLMWVARAWALRVGELTGLGDGVFFLTLDELLGLLKGEGAPTAAIPARQATFARYQALPPYPMVIRGRFDPDQWAADPHRRTDLYDSHGLLPTLAPGIPDQRVVVGTAGAAGRVEGLVRRLDSPDQGHLLQPGEILVTSQTNIGWTLLFPRAGAIVTDVGAPLSHAAIVARELGIPAVVNCGDATSRLRTGDHVRVDGVCGTVEILDTPE